MESKKFLRLTATYNGLLFEIEESQPGIGFYFYVYDRNGMCTHDYLQDTLIMTKECALEEFGIPLNAWRET